MELRGVKAELLKAKAQAQLAEAAIKTAQANLEQAKADFLAEKVAQENCRQSYWLHKLKMQRKLLKRLRQ